EQVRAYVQSVADATPENGASIIESSGLAVRKSPTHAARAFTAKAGAVSGTVKLYAVSVGHRSAYLWEYSVDGGKTWVQTPVSLQAKTTVTGLTPGQTVQFRYQPVSKTGPGDWSQTVSLIVK
ncbi:MAG TPA: fibronectin type III domain-containing protein, partial [Polyangiaceae bacterium]